MINLIDHFIFRNHICLTFDLLDLNLYQLIKSKNSNHKGLDKIKRFTEQILSGINYYHNLNIIHCDIKPENIMIIEAKSLIKIIDFGSGCFDDKKIFTYIQSRYYRAPEVILEIGYDNKIDIWSLGCVIAEMYIGKPIFTGREEIEHFFCIIEVLGLPPSNLLEKSPKKHVIQEYIKKVANSGHSKFRAPGIRSLKTLIDCNDTLFLDLITSNIYIELLTWDPDLRLSSKEALNHEWFNKTPTLRHTSSMPIIKRDDSITRLERKSLVRKEILHKVN